MNVSDNYKIYDVNHLTLLSTLKNLTSLNVNDNYTIMNVNHLTLLKTLNATRNSWITQNEIYKLKNLIIK